MNQEGHKMISEDSLKKIQSLLDRQIELAEKILSIIRDEQEALTNMDTDSLFSLARMKSENLDRMAARDCEIRKKIAEIASIDQLNGERPVKLSEILPFINEKQSTQIKTRGHQLSQLRKKIINKTVVNKEFTSNVLGYLEDAVSLIVNGIQENPVYNRQKQGTVDKSRPTLVSKEI